MATLKSILDAMMAETGFLIPSAYASSASPDDVQLLHLANAASDEIREAGLTAAKRFYTLTLTTATDYALPADFWALVSDTAWTGQLPANLPVGPAEWGALRATGVGNARLNARIFGTTLKVINPNAGQTVVLEYISKYPWKSASMVEKELATADDDDWQLDRRALLLGTKWRFLKAKGLPDWQAEMQLAQSYMRTLNGRDGGAQSLYFGGPGFWDGSPQTNVVTS